MSKRALQRDIYGGRDPRSIPVYSTVEAAHYLRIPVQTIKSWVHGRTYPVKAGQGRATAIVLPDRTTGALSFLNLLELHILGAIRRDHQVDMKRVRTALAYLGREFKVEHPLADVAMETDGRSLFVKTYGRLINASEESQVAMDEVLEAHLKRIERNERGLAIRLFPFTQKNTIDAPRVVSMDPLVAFGRPVLVGSRITTADVADRFKAGESVDSLAKDYGRTKDEILEAIRCELETAA